MDNCDLEKLAVSVVNLCLWFKPDLTLYTATVASHIREVTLDVLTSDCGASYVVVSMTSIRFSKFVSIVVLYKAN